MLHDSLKAILDVMTKDWNYRLTAVHLVDAHLCTEPSKCARAEGGGRRGTHSPQSVPGLGGGGEGGPLQRALTNAAMLRVGRGGGTPVCRALIDSCVSDRLVEGWAHLCRALIVCE